MKPIWITRIAATLTMMGLAAAACGQYIWLDDKGVKQFSDMPPPASVPQKNILKQPNRTPIAAPASTDSDSNNAAAKNPLITEKANVPMTTAEKNADFQKRKAKQAEMEAKAAEEAKNAAIKAKNCDNARSYQRSLTSGERIATTDKNGERFYLNDEQKAKEAKDAQNI
ncbi:MAG: DUF4124 domain-containing protein, partial [Burkholderiaceae bacterium]